MTGIEKQKLPRIYEMRVGNTVVWTYQYSLGRTGALWRQHFESSIQNRKTAPDSKLLLKLVDSFVLSYSYAFTDTNVQLKPIKT